jgi:hypothetical protein
MSWSISVRLEYECNPILPLVLVKVPIVHEEHPVAPAASRLVTIHCFFAVCAGTDEAVQHYDM